MSGVPLSGGPRLPTPAARQIDRVCDRFEDTWLAGTQPRIEEYVAGIPEPDRAALWRELMVLELDYRHRAGETPTPADYEQRFPEYQPLIRTLVEEHSSGKPDASSISSEAPVAAPTVSDGHQPCIPGYEILGVLGQGAMGVVYKARQLRLNRLVALKMILTGGYTGERERERFRAEAEAVAQLHNPHVVQVYDVGEAEGKPFFSMELVDGGSLADRLEGTPLRPSRAAQLVETVARAMHAAHRDGVVHRDLKPANILLSADGTPKITDFGLAKQLDRDSSQTKSGTVLGTPSYMAPEQAAGRTHVIGPSADVYALGAILYHALTGRAPFKGASVLDTLEQVRSREPVPPRQIHPDIPRDLETVCLKCLQKEPRHRYASAEALAEDLRAYREGRPIQARPITVWEQTLKWMKRRPVEALLWSAVLGIVLLIVGFVWKSREAQTQEHGKDVERQRGDRLLFHLSLERASNLCQQGDLARGMLWLTRALDISHSDIFLPDEGAGLGRAVRANLSAWRGRLHGLRHVLAHPAAVENALFSPDGRLVITVGADNAVRLWDAATAAPLGQPLPHPGPVFSIGCSADSRFIVTGCADGAARLWDAATGRPVLTPMQTPAPAKPLRAVAFSPDGKTILTAGDDRILRLWETATAALLHEGRGHQGAVLAVTFSPNGHTILTGGADHTARLWDAATLKPGSVLNEEGEVVDVDFSPWGKLLMTLTRKQGAEAENAVDLWSAGAGNSHIARLQHPGGVVTAAFSPSGRKILTGGLDRTARLWDTDKGTPLGTPFHHEDVVLGVAFSPDGKSFLTRSQDETVRVWDEATGKLLGQPLEHQGAVQAAAFSPDAHTILTASHDHSARLWEMASARLYRQEFGHPARVLTTGFSPDGLTMVTGSGNQLIRRRVPGGNPLGSLRHDKEVWAAAFHPKGTMILTATKDNVARLWDTATERPIRTFEHRQQVRAVAFSPDGSTILTGSGDTEGGEIRLWDAATSKLRGTPLTLPAPVWAVAFSVDGTHAAVATGSNGVRLYDLESRKGTELASLHKTRVVALAFSPDGRLLLTGSMDRTARLWNTITHTAVGAPLQHQGAVWAAAFSPDGQTLVTGAGDSSARVWDTASGTAVGPVWPHNDVVWAVAFHPDGRSVLTGSGDKHARLWETPAPASGSLERIRLWAQVITGMELDEEGIVHRLSATGWEQRRRRLEELGGPPLP